MIKCRPFIEEDRQRLAKMYCRLNTETFSWMPPGSFSVDDFDKDTKGEKIIVATDDNELLGFVAIQIEKNKIHHLYVDSCAQGKGIGKVLLQESLKYTARPTTLNCRVKNKNALEFYRKFGFQIKSEIPGPPDDYYQMVIY